MTAVQEKIAFPVGTRVTDRDRDGVVVAHVARDASLVQWDEGYAMRALNVVLHEVR